MASGLWNLQNDDEAPKRNRKSNVPIELRDGTDRNWDDDPDDRDLCREEKATRRYTRLMTITSLDQMG